MDPTSCLVAVGLGFAIKRSGVVDRGLAQEALRLATFTTLPALVFIRFLGRSGSLVNFAFTAAPPAVLLTFLTAALTWWSFQQRQTADRALLPGAASALNLRLLAYPFVEAVFARDGLVLAILFDLAHSAAAFAINQALWQRSGLEGREVLVHSDGATYRGQRRGSVKHGVGAYKYASGASYDGEWVNNVKQGRGIFRFAKGGFYEGEWSKGEREGLGVRLMRSGKIQAGKWQAGKLMAIAEPWQLAPAVAAARHSAQAARGLVAPATVPGLLPVIIVAATVVASVAVSTLSIRMPMTVGSGMLQLASAHGPLVLIAQGILLDPQLPNVSEAGSIVQMLRLQLLPPLAMSAIISVALGPACAGVMLLCGLAHLPGSQDTIRTVPGSSARDLQAAAGRIGGPAIILLMLAMGIASTLQTSAAGWCGTLAAAGLIIMASTWALPRLLLKRRQQTTGQAQASSNMPNAGSSSIPTSPLANDQGSTISAAIDQPGSKAFKAAAVELLGPEASMKSSNQDVSGSSQAAGQDASDPSEHKSDSVMGEGLSSKPRKQGPSSMQPPAAFPRMEKGAEACGLSMAAHE
ncbi:hypothetical protein WJX74_005831 [Apatococcus lobatus]|uniref:Uncharacterized protein n=1 Tax=Apatococcus lobatus TaxID=904363 RepID=A0AAW1QHI3_9CHLO